jgi:hypothetical protein
MGSGPCPRRAGWARAEGAEKLVAERRIRDRGYGRARTEHREMGAKQEHGREEHGGQRHGEQARRPSRGAPRAGGTHG